MINPYRNVDLNKMDSSFRSLVASSYNGAGGGETPLSQAERATFRVGLLLGGKAWDSADREIKDALARGRLTRDDLGRILEHDLVLMGASVEEHLQRLGGVHGVALPSMHEAVTAWAETAHGDMDRARFQFVLGLGITWGAGCWDS